MTALLEKLARDHRLTREEYGQLLQLRPRELGILADRVRRDGFGTRVQLQGVLDISSICRFACPLCGLGSGSCMRYRLRPREIIDICEEAFAMDVGTIVLRSGFDGFYTDHMLCSLLQKLRDHLPGCAIELALGERDRESLEQLYNAGAEGCRLLQETAVRSAFEDLHPAELSFDRRLHCLNELKDIGFRTGCGFLVGWPGQRSEELARELKFLEEFQPDRVELVPLAGDTGLVDCLISVIRLMLPGARITAPGITGVLAGADTVTVGLMPTQDAFPLCGGPRAEGPVTNASLAALRRSLAEVGFEVL